MTYTFATFYLTENFIEIESNKTEISKLNNLFFNDLRFTL